MNLIEYQNFVVSTASEESKNLAKYIESLMKLNSAVNVPMLHTAGIGMAKESGEFAEIIAKITFQGKPLTDDVIYHMKRELGDVAWYLVLGCAALNINLEEILEMNKGKLEARYPNGFEVERSENRAEGDI